MTATPITIERMRPIYNQEVSRLLVDGFRGKFQALTKLSDDELAHFFEKLPVYFPDEPGELRMVALQNGEVIGTMTLKWKTEAPAGSQARHYPSWQELNTFGKWNLLKLLTGLRCLAYQPADRECYIADLSVHHHHRSKGVGKQLLQWAQYNMQTKPDVDYLSLHVSARNQRAKQLYEQLSFRSCAKETSILRYLLFKEYEWEYMTSLKASDT